MTTRYSTAAAPSGRQLNMGLISGPFLDARPRLNRLLELQIHPTKFNIRQGQLIDAPTVGAGGRCVI
jgi:hypothetical protein